MHIKVNEGDYISGGTIIAETQETRAIMHKSMVPPTVSGTVIKTAPDGEYTINDTILFIVTKKKDGSTIVDLSLHRNGQSDNHVQLLKDLEPHSLWLQVRELWILSFLLQKAVLLQFGGFGTGKTMNQHQIAKWADADIIIYIGCGERGK